MVRYDTLRKTRDLDRVFQHGRWLRSEAVSIGMAPREGSAPARVAFVAGRRIGTAVRRNRARRRLREALRTSSLLLGPGNDLVLLARRDTADIAFARLQSAVCRGLVRLGAATTDAPQERSRNDVARGGADQGV